MIATRHGNTQVRRGDKLAAFRVIPLAIQEKYLDEADRAAGSSPILSLHPWKIKKAAVITTGSEIYKGRIQDTFTPVIEEKLAYFDVKMIRHELCDDDTEQIKQAILDARAAGAELILCTGGMSVDPDDRTPGAVRQSGAQIVTYGAPLLPGAMFLMGYLPKTEDTVISPETNCWDEPAPENAVPVLGLPGCVMYAARTVFDVFLPRILAGRRIRKRDIVVSGEGGLCLGCDICTFPNCGFGKQETV
jgi:molybdenum cofactor synthesis domain-containing protein